MKNRIATLACALILCATAAFSALPTRVLGPGTGLSNFRVPYHQIGNVTLYADSLYILTGWYFVDSTYSLTIQPGTMIQGDKPSGGALIVKRGAQIHASGTAQYPIIFTSGQIPANRAPGDWGGVVILGNAPTNQSPNIQIEGGFNTIPNTYAGYGGPDVNDNSGELQYVRIEFGGIAFAQDNEINGLTFGGVGKGTTFDHVQVSFANDDDFEFFGGTIQGKYLVGWRSLDDCFDTDFGFDGKLQHMYTKRDPLIFDNSASGQSNGEESDNNGTAPYFGFPTTKARFSNWTLIGPVADSTTSISAKWGHAALLRRGTHLSIHNSVMGGWKMGINLRDTLTQNAALQDSLQLRHISLAAPWSGTNRSIMISSSPSTYNTLTDPVGWFNNPTWGNIGATPVRQASALGLPAEVWNLNNTNNPVPSLGSEPATAGTGYYGTNLQGDAWYDSVSYRGAFAPGVPMNQQWTAGWTNFEPENTDYSSYQGVSTVSCSLTAGWNLVSIPNTQSNYSATAIFTGAFGDMFQYSNGAYSPAPTLADGVGYWAYYTTAQTAIISGAVRSATTIPVVAGWNLVGSRQVTINTSSLTTNPAGLIFGDIFGYNNGAYAPTLTIAAGQGVWVYCTGNGTLTIP